MNILLLGRGKTGSLVAEAARQRGHDIRVAGAAENSRGEALTAEKLRGIDVVIDFTTPSCVPATLKPALKPVRTWSSAPPVGMERLSG